MENDINDPSKPSEDYLALMQILELPLALMGGTRAMRLAGETFLPKERQEDPKDYTARLNRSFLLGGYERNVSILSGEVFDKPVTVSKEMSVRISSLFDNVDLLNQNLTQFARNFFEWALICATGHILVDIQPLPLDANGKSIQTNGEQDKLLGRRPYFIHIPAINLIGWKFNDNNELSQVRIREFVEEEVGNFGYKSIEQIRVLYPGRWEVYRKSESKDGDKQIWVLYSNGTSPLNKIALATLFTGKRKSKLTASPSLTGLAELNQQHWVSSSDQNNILHTARVPILFGKCLQVDDDGKIVIAPNNLIHSSVPDGDLRYVEHTGQAIGEGWKDLERIEKLMALYGLDLIANERSGNITATEKALTGAKVGSFLNAVALACQDTLNTAIGFMCEILKEQYTEGIAVNTDFSLALSGFDTSLIIAAFNANIIDRATAIDELKRRGAISENADPVSIAAAIQNESGSFSSFGQSFLTKTGV